jgi:hypothetical protein
MSAVTNIICNKITFLNPRAFVGFVLINFTHLTKARNCELIKLLNVQKEKFICVVNNTEKKLLKLKAAINCSKACRSNHLTVRYTKDCAVILMHCKYIGIPFLTTLKMAHYWRNISVGIM